MRYRRGCFLKLQIQGVIIHGTNNNVNEKFEILKDQFIEHNGRILYRIRALRDIGEYVKKGDLGGFIQHEFNLSRYGECWVFQKAKVYDDGLLTHNATACGLSEIFENAKVGNSTEICDNAKVYGNAEVGGLSVWHDAHVYGDAYIGSFGFAQDEARVHGTASLSEWGEGAYGNEDVASFEEFHAVEELRYSRWAEFEADQERRKNFVMAGSTHGFLGLRSARSPRYKKDSDFRSSLDTSRRLHQLMSDSRY